MSFYLKNFTGYFYFKLKNIWPLWSDHTKLKSSFKIFKIDISSFIFVLHRILPGFINPQ